MAEVDLDRDVLALIRHIIIQAARDAELELVSRSDDELRNSILILMRDLAESDWQAAVQSDHQPSLARAAERFVQEDEPELAIIMYATAVEHWLNGMIEVGLKRRGEMLDPESERGNLAHKLTTRWNELFATPVPDGLRDSIITLARARNDVVHYKWPMHSETEHKVHNEARSAVARDAPRLLAALSGLENSIVFHGARAQLDRVLDDMELFDTAWIG